MPRGPAAARKDLEPADHPAELPPLLEIGHGLIKAPAGDPDELAGQQRRTREEGGATVASSAPG